MFIGALAPSSEPPPVCAVDLLPARKEECSLTFQASFGNEARSPSATRFGAIGMTINVTRRAAVIGLSTCIALPVRAQTTSRSKDAADTLTLEQPAVFDITANTGSLKETVQKGQQLVWRRKGAESDGGFQVSNVSIAFLRSESGGQVKTCWMAKARVDQDRICSLARSRRHRNHRSSAPLTTCRRGRKSAV